MLLRAVIMAIQACLELRLRAIVLAEANEATIVLFDLLHGLWRVLDAIIADRTRNLAIAIDRNGIGRNVSAGARHAQDQG